MRLEKRSSGGLVLVIYHMLQHPVRRTPVNKGNSVAQIAGSRVLVPHLAVDRLGYLELTIMESRSPCLVSATRQLPGLHQEKGLAGFFGVMNVVKFRLPSAQCMLAGFKKNQQYQLYSPTKILHILQSRV